MPNMDSIREYMNNYTNEVIEETRAIMLFTCVNSCTKSLNVPIERACEILGYRKSAYDAAAEIIKKLEGKS